VVYLREKRCKPSVNHKESAGKYKSLTPSSPNPSPYRSWGIESLQKEKGFPEVVKSQQESSLDSAMPELVLQLEQSVLEDV
jgi:hypothetical protein